MSDGSRGGSTLARQSRRRRLPLLGAWAFLVYLFLALPLLVVVAVSFNSASFIQFPPEGLSLRWYESFIKSEQMLAAFGLSLRVAGLATLIALALGIPVAVALVRHGRFRGATALQGLMVAPLIVPYILLAVGLFYVNLKLGLRGSVTSIVIAHVVIALPYVVVLVTAGLYGVPRNLEEAARGLGASPPVVFFRVTLPLILPSIAAAAIFVFVVSWDEFILAYLLSSPGVKTLPVVIFELLRERVDPTISAVATLLILFTLIAVLAVERLREAARRRGDRVAGISDAT